MDAPTRKTVPQSLAPTRRWWSVVWAALPVRAFLLSLVAALLVWGRFLLPGVTISPEAQEPTVHPGCRVGSARLECQLPYVQQQGADFAATAWQELPADYFFRRAREHGEPWPQWNPYVGSGYPIALDGINAATSPTRRFLSHFPGDQGRDILVFARFVLWSFGLVWAAGLCGAGTPVLAGVAAVAVLAPYPASYVDIVFLDVDLLAPWFLLILLALVTNRLSLRAAVGLSLALGIIVSAMGFVQAQIVLCAAAGLLALAAAPATRGRSLALAACIGAGALVVASPWLGILRNLDQFVTSRQVQCIIEKSMGASAFAASAIDPPLGQFQFWSGTATIAGAALLPFLPRRWWFVFPALAAMGAWIVLGLPHAACALPIVSGIRFMRHLVAHFEVLFIFAVALAIQALSERLDRRLPWLVFALACAIASAIATRAHPVLVPRLLGSCAVGAGLGLAAALLRRASGSLAMARRAAFAIGLILFAFLPYLFSSRMALLLWEGAAGAPEMAALPDEIDASTPVGAVRRLSEREDRRHFSPGGFLFPNWSGALGILDILSIGAFYPLGYHELNATLFGFWEGDPQHGIVPDRFCPRPAWVTKTLEFQRVMAVNRVSLLTFSWGQAYFPSSPSPYEASRCRLLGRSQAQFAESYLCPEVGGIGYFPEMVRAVSSREEALAILQRLSPSDILHAALIGPEVDLAGAEPGTVTPGAGVGRVLSVDRRNDDLTYALDVERAGTFVIADTYFRGWRATVNGAAAGISRANVAFKAVSVPRGKVELKLHFEVAP